MSRTAERLRDAASAVGAMVTEHDLPELQLGAPLRARPRWSGGRWLVPLVAAASVVAAVGSVTVLGQFLGDPAASHRPGPNADQNPPPLLTTPKYLVTAQAAQGYVKSVATGRTIARIPPPVKDYRIEGLAAAPGNRVFYLAGEVGNARGGRLVFFRIRLRPDGHPQPAERLPGHSVQLPLPITSDGLVNIVIAVSPDGSHLAYSWPRDLLGEPASQPSTIVVRDVATGSIRTWDATLGGQTEISQLSWAAGGQLSYVAMLGHSAVRHGRVVRDRDHDLSVLAVLNTLREAGNLLSSSRLIRYASRQSGSTAPSPEVAGGLITADGRTVIAWTRAAGRPARLAAISTVTRKVTWTLVAGPQASQADPAAVDGDNLLFTLSPHAVHEGPAAPCGHLALARLSTGRITALPFAVYCPVDSPEPSFVAW